MTPREVQAAEERAAARAISRAKWGDGSQQIETHDLAFFSADEIKALIDAGRISGVGADKRLGRR
jgi:hypothetical protein